MKSQRFRRVHKNSKVRKGKNTRNKRKTMRRKSMRKRKTMRRKSMRKRKRTRRRRGGMDPAAPSGAHPAGDRDGSEIDAIASQTKMSPEQRKEAIKKKIPKEEADEAKNSTAVDAAELVARDNREGPGDFSVHSKADFPSL